MFITTEISIKNILLAVMPSILMLFFVQNIFAAQPIITNVNTEAGTFYIDNLTSTGQSPDVYMSCIPFSLDKSTGPQLWLNQVNINYAGFGNTAALKKIRFCECSSGNPTAAACGFGSQCQCDDGGGTTSPTYTKSFGSGYNGKKLVDNFFIAFFYYEVFPNLSAAQANQDVTTQAIFQYTDSVVGDIHTVNVTAKYPFCGDGDINASAGENCDDGNQVSGDGCSATCQPECGPAGKPSSNTTAPPVVHTTIPNYDDLCPDPIDPIISPYVFGTKLYTWKCGSLDCEAEIIACGSAGTPEGVTPVKTYTLAQIQSGKLSGPLCTGSPQPSKWATPGTADGTGVYLWQCGSQDCQAEVIACGSANGKTYTTASLATTTDTLCSKNAQKPNKLNPPKAGSSQWTWQCKLNNVVVDCAAILDDTPNCGKAHAENDPKLKFTSASQVNQNGLCQSGWPSPPQATNVKNSYFNTSKGRWEWYCKLSSSNYVNCWAYKIPACSAIGLPAGTQPPKIYSSTSPLYGNDLCAPLDDTQNFQFTTNSSGTIHFTWDCVFGTEPPVQCEAFVDTPPGGTIPPGGSNPNNCGNGTIDAGEQCEPPNTAVCDANCQFIGGGTYCGDNIIQAPNDNGENEQCEPPNTATCDASCQNIVPPPSCGNGTVDAGEQCEPPNTATCDANCQTIGGTTPDDPGGGSGGGGDPGSSPSSDPYGGSGTVDPISGTGTPIGGEACYFDMDCDKDTINANTTSCTLPTLTVADDGYVTVPFDVSKNPSECLEADEICVQVGTTHIVGNQSGGDISSDSDVTFSDCLPNNSTSFKIANNNLIIPAQNKMVVKVKAGTYMHDEVLGCCDSVCTQNDCPQGYHEPTHNSQTKDFGDTCYFDTRIPPIHGTGTNCSRVLDGVYGAENICDSVYPEARSMMNPRIKQILQPFHEDEQCFYVPCASGAQTKLCGCDATGNGVTLQSLDVLPPAGMSFSNTQYVDRSNSSVDPINGEMQYLSDCARGNVIFFDPPSGGSVTLDNPTGDDFVLPPYPVTLAIRGADLRIKDNLVYPSNAPNASLGVIMLGNDDCGLPPLGGNVFVHPAPTNIVGAYYLEGSVKSTNTDWTLPHSSTTDPRDNSWWYDTFKNQLLWEGTIVSKNTIGGTVDHQWPQSNCYASQGPEDITHGFIGMNWDSAVEYDLAYLREYFQCGAKTNLLHSYGTDNWKISECDTSNDEIAYSGESAKGTTTSEVEAVVVRYDSRIQNNPPPGFETLTQILQTETGF